MKCQFQDVEKSLVDRSWKGCPLLLNSPKITKLINDKEQ